MIFRVMKRTVLFVLLICLVIASCKKGGETITKDEAIKLEDLIGRYTLTEYVSHKPGDDFYVNTNSNEKPCMLNALFTLNKDNSATSEYIGTDVCYLFYKSPNENINFGPHELENLIWKFVNNEVQLQINSTSSIHHYSITKKDNKIQLTEIGEAPFNYKQTYTKK
ncbi:hypothetical protein ACVW0P_003475 [Mucilaginibacter sp. UYNi724]